MRKASPLVMIPGLAQVEVDEAAAVPTEFVDIETSNVYTGGGIVAPSAITNAMIPNWQHYDTGRFVFGPIDDGGDDPLDALTVELWGIDAQGVAMLLGQSELNAGGSLPRIENVPIAGRMQYAIRVAAIEFDSGEVPDGAISFSVFAQGYYRNDTDS
jgi:hypothetical protein